MYPWGHIDSVTGESIRRSISKRLCESEEELSYGPGRDFVGTEPRLVVHGCILLTDNSVSTVKSAGRRRRQGGRDVPHGYTTCPKVRGALRSSTRHGLRGQDCRLKMPGAGRSLDL